MLLKFFVRSLGANQSCRTGYPRPLNCVSSLDCISSSVCGPNPVQGVALAPHELH